MYLHRTKDGSLVPLDQLTDSHLANILSFLKRKATNGVTVCSGGGVCADETWYDEDILYGEEALDHLNYYEYADEAKRREGINHDCYNFRSI